MFMTKSESNRSTLMTDDLVEQVNVKIHENQPFTISELYFHFPNISLSVIYDTVAGKLYYKKNYVADG